MALKNTTITQYGFEIQNSYNKVGNVLIVKKTELEFELNTSKDSDSDFFKKTKFNTSYDINGENPIKQAYLHLKTLPEFSDAVDC